MNLLDFEIAKIRHRQTMKFLFCFYAISLPLIVNSLTSLERSGTEDTYIDDVVFAIFRFTLLYLFLPLWVILLTGMELRNGHAHRVIFIRSRNYYFLSKCTFCLITAFYFAGIGVITLSIAAFYSPYPLLEIGAMVYLKVSIQAFITFFLYSLFLMSLVFLIRNVVATFVVYYGWLIFEHIIFLIAGKSGTKLSYLPIHLLNGLFANDGVVEAGNYFMVFDQWKPSYIGVVVMVTIMLLAAYKYFMRISLPSLSD